MTPLSSDGVATVRWSLLYTGGLNITALRVDYFTPATDLFITINSTVDLRQQSSVQVNGLTAGEFYTFRVTVSNDLGDTVDVCSALWLTTGNKPTNLLL